MWLEHFSMEEFVARYEPQFKRVLRAMERVEAISPPTKPKFSMEMREAWKSGRILVLLWD